MIDKYTHQERHSHRSKANNQIKVLEKQMTICTGFTYCGRKLFNRLPNNIKESQDINSFKTLTKVGFGKKSRPIKPILIINIFINTSHFIDIAD
jgi:hypothetical protein